MPIHSSSTCSLQPIVTNCPHTMPNQPQDNNSKNNDSSFASSSASASVGAAAAAASPSSVRSTFHEFFEGWIVRQRRYLNELLLCDQDSEEDMKCLVGRILAHYQQYFEEKSRLVPAKVFVLFSPPWFSRFEKTFLWIAGFRPGMAFRFVERSVRDLSREQKEKMKKLKAQTRSSERDLSVKFATWQETVGGPGLNKMARSVEREVDGEVGEVNDTLDVITEALQGLVTNADYLRATTARSVVEILSPTQTVKFLTQTAQFQLKIRDYGMQRDAERQSSFN